MTAIDHTIREGDQVTSLGDPGVWLVRTILRANAGYLRRAVIERDGIVRQRPITVLRKQRKAD